MDQGFDFNRWVRDGISYLAAAERDMLQGRLASAASGHDDRPGISVHKPDDVQFVAELLAQVAAWLEVRQKRGGDRSLALKAKLSVICFIAHPPVWLQQIEAVTWRERSYSEGPPGTCSHAGTLQGAFCSADARIAGYLPHQGACLYLVI